MNTINLKRIEKAYQRENEELYREVIKLNRENKILKDVLRDTEKKMIIL